MILLAAALAAASTLVFLHRHHPGAARRAQRLRPRPPARPWWDLSAAGGRRFPFLASVAAALARRRTRRRSEAMALAVADAVDLVAVGARAGLNAHRSLELAAEAAAPPLRQEIRRVVDGVACGRPLAEGLSDLARRVPLDGVAALCRCVEQAHRRGLPLAEAAERAADEIRVARRQAAEASARTAPVKMLFPLAFLILPSFLLLTAVPLLVVALRQVRV